MRKDAFTAFALCTLGADTVRSYIGYLIRVERELGIDLDSAGLETEQIETLKARLSNLGLPSSSVRNCGSALQCYANFRAIQPSAALPHRRQRDEGAAPSRARSTLVREASVIELLRLYAAVLDELKERGVLRTGNGPLGDYAERLFASAFGWRLAVNAASGFDAECGGVHYQIKARRLATPNGSRQLGVIRNLEGRPFDVLAAVLFDGRFDVQRAALIPYEIVVERAKWTKHVNGHRFLLPEAVWELPGVEDVTLALRAAVDR